MSITSEKQKRYDPTNGGFSYYTLFHADKGERPSWAQDGDMLEEFGEGGKAYVCSRDAKGRIKWTEKADWDRQTGGGSGGGADLPTGTNDGDLLVWDGTDDEWKAGANPYAPLMVTLTLDASGQNPVAVANKTFLQIFEASKSGKTVKMLFDMGSEYDGVFDVINCGRTSADTYEIIFAVVGEPATFVVLSGAATDYPTQQLA